MSVCALWLSVYMKSFAEQGFFTNSYSTTKPLKHLSKFEFVENVRSSYARTSSHLLVTYYGTYMQNMDFPKLECPSLICTILQQRLIIYHIHYYHIQYQYMYGALDHECSHI